MQNFIVLGYIPGTQTQISFTAWLVAFLLFVASITLYFRWRKIICRIVAIRLTLHIRRQTIIA